MKKNIIALAIAAAVAAPVAQAAPTVYGKLNLNLNQTTDQGMSVNSSASRLGIKGAQQLDGSLKAVYKIEFGLDAMADGNPKSPVSQRNAFLGLAGGFGTVLMGRHDTPLKMSQPTDLFNDGVADLGKFAGGMGFAGKGGEDRVSEVLAYVSPSFSGFKFVVAGVSNDAAGNLEDQSITNTTSLAAMYGSTKKGIFVSAGMNNISEEATGGEAGSELRVSGQYKGAGLVANLMYQTFDDGLEDDVSGGGTNIQLNLGYQIGKVMPKLKYSTVSRTSDAYDDGSAYAIGLNYSLAKKTKAYIYTSSISGEMRAPAIAEADATTSIVAGMVHDF